MLRYLLIVISFFSISVVAHATHNRAGEITYRHLYGFTYEITVTTCTKTSVEADRQWIYINWGDSPSCTFNDSIERDFIFFDVAPDAQLNIYTDIHTYSGPGSFNIQMLDPNRNLGVVNIEGSVSVPFYIESELIISPITGHNNSVVLLNPAKSNVCLNQCWEYNPAAFDPDGDQLVYSLVECKGDSCEDIPNYEYPDESTPDPTDYFVIDENTGTVEWCVPMLSGEYNFAILIEEYREVDGNLFKVGSVTRDMQINVVICDNQPPVMDPVLDTCVMIYDPLLFSVSASDPDGDDVDISALGGPLTEVENTAMFNNSTNTFSWIPECTEVQNAPYQVTFIATDESSQLELQDIQTMNIRVISPPVENTDAQAIEGNIYLSWDNFLCMDSTEQDNEDFSYKIYRRNDEYGYDPGSCETGVPDYTGYELIDVVEGLENNSYVDETAFYGGYYCYMIVTCWPDGAESVASDEFCAEIKKDVPVITNVSVLTTNDAFGVDSIAWSPPTELDTEQYPGPYQYRLYWSDGFDGASELIYSGPENTDLFADDTTFIHSGINTFDEANNYRVEFYSGGSMVAETPDASSVFIELIPDDNQLTIDIQYEVPWLNTTFEIYRQNGTLWDLIGTTSENTFVDTNLTNNETYCYFVRSIGTYNAEFVVDPIINDSQEACGFPVDLTPPCPPELFIDDECEYEVSELTWTNPATICGADDVMLYQLYYTPVEGEDFELIETFVNNGQNVFNFNADGEYNSIAGCFYITAIDSLQPGLDGVDTSNESDPSNIICIDNCPNYELPNIFTPNGDEDNQFFRPFDPVLYIDSVDFQIFNRWGNLVFQTSDPLIGWDGRYSETGELCSDGTYYYTASVFTIRLQGIVPRKMSGYIQLQSGKDTPTE